MDRNMTRRDILVKSSGIACLGSLGCGTVLHPERIGQAGGRIDWRIVGLDTAGLLLFFVPGVIAFAIDFYNGTIFLPPDEFCGRIPEKTELTEVKVTDGKLTQDNVERIVSGHLGKQVTLVSGDVQTKKLDSIDQFWASAQQMYQRMRDTISDA